MLVANRPRHMLSSTSARRAKALMVDRRKQLAVSREDFLRALITEIESEQCTHYAKKPQEPHKRTCLHLAGKWDTTNAE